MEDIFEIWGNDVITGDREANKPTICLFNNSIKACEMLHKHFKNKQNIIIHCDVDVDGIGQGYIVKRFSEYNTNGQIKYCINKNKIHGIQYKHAEAFNQIPLDLLIIVDSSSNEVDILKKFHCDVLVIDHHEVLHKHHSGKTEDGHDFIIVNNVLEGENPEIIKEWLSKLGVNTSEIIEKYQPTDMMSCGLTIYELFRLYQVAYQTGPILENSMLFQWSAITLFTDQVQMLNERNQWYIQNTVCQNSIESCLEQLMKNINPRQTILDKQFIVFKLAPLINKAIRADAGIEAVNAVMNKPQEIVQLARFQSIQQEALEKGKKFPKIGNYILWKDITNDGISNNYTGVIAASLSGEFSRQQAVYSVQDGKAIGSFRGTSNNFDYREFFERHREGNYAQGHKAAFGFQLDIDELKSILNELDTMNTSNDFVNYLTAGDIPENLKGKHHIYDINNFKKSGGLLRLAIGNSRVNNSEQIEIIVPLSQAKLVEQKGKIYIYDILGIQCKAFELLKNSTIRVYAEQSNLLNIYAKN